jgi:hypothetical protein
MAFTEQNEQVLANARGQRRQDKRVPLLIRDDGMLYPNVPLVAKKNNFRPYHGDPKASLEERMRYLQGFGQQRRKVVFEQPDEAFELGKATADEIVAFAMQEYGAALDPSTPIDTLRAECYRLSQLPDMDLPIAAQGAGMLSGGIAPAGTPSTGSVRAKPTSRRGGSTAVV